MEINFLGVGEACDPARYNTSLLVSGRSGTKEYYILLDCGFTTPHRYFLGCSEKDQLDALWISHFHGDHFFGVPLLLLRFSEMGRQKPLLVVGPLAVQEKVELALELAYPSFMARLGYELHFLQLSPELAPFEAAGCLWRFAPTEHSQSCLAVRLEAGGSSLFYSGDGCPTHASRNLARGCDLIVHESYRVDGKTANHGNMNDCVQMARQAEAGRLALVHVAHFERAFARSALRDFAEKNILPEMFLPEPGERIEL